MNELLVEIGNNSLGNLSTIHESINESRDSQVDEPTPYTMRDLIRKQHAFSKSTELEFKCRKSMSQEHSNQQELLFKSHYVQMIAIDKELLNHGQDEVI